MRFLVAIMNDQIPRVRNPIERVGENDHVMLVVKQRIRKKQQRANETQPPEQSRHGDLFLFFRRIPLNQKPGGKSGVGQPADGSPENNPVHNLPHLKSKCVGIGDNFSRLLFSAARDDFDNFQFVARIQNPPGKFRRRDGLAVVLHDDAARQQFLLAQKRLNRAW